MLSRWLCLRRNIIKMTRKTFQGEETHTCSSFKLFLVQTQMKNSDRSWLIDQKFSTPRQLRTCITQMPENVLLYEVNMINKFETYSGRGKKIFLKKNYFNICKFSNLYPPKKHKCLFTQCISVLWKCFNWITRVTPFDLKRCPHVEYKVVVPF